MGKTSRRIIRLGGKYILLLLVLFLMLAPLLWELSTSLQGKGVDLYADRPNFLPTNPSLSAYNEVNQIVPIMAYLRNSLIVSIICLLGNILGASAAGYALAKFDFRGRKISLAVFIMGITIPVEVILISRYLFMEKLSLTNTLLGVALPSACSALNVLLMKNAISAIPDSFEEAAKIDGANAWQRFIHIVIPSVRGTIAVVAIFSFSAAWDDFLWPLISLSDQDKYTLTVGLNYLKGTFSNNPRVIAAGTIIAIIPMLILFIVLQKQFFKGIGEGGIKG